MSHARVARKSSQASQTRDAWRKERSKIHIVSRKERFPIVSGLTFTILILKKSNLYMTRNTKFHVKALLSLFFEKNGKAIRFHSQNINLKVHIVSVYNLLQR